MYYKYYKDYLGVYVPNGDILNGAPVYKNENGKMIHIRHERTVWSVGDADAVHDKGVLRADNQRAASPCLATATDWEFWDDRKGRNIPIHSIDFTLTCGKSQGDSLPFPRSICSKLAKLCLLLFHCFVLFIDQIYFDPGELGAIIVSGGQIISGGGSKLQNLASVEVILENFNRVVCKLPSLPFSRHECSDY